MHRVPGKKLARHGQLRGAWVFMPIEEFDVDDVWRFLLSVKSPWGGDNRQLSNLYQSAQDGECPLVVDDLTPSCGNSRFGCWTCTVVTRDKSMEAVIEIRRALDDSALGVPRLARRRPRSETTRTQTRGSTEAATGGYASQKTASYSGAPTPSTSAATSSAAYSTRSGRCRSTIRDFELISEG